MVGLLPLAPQHDSLQYIHHVHLMERGQNRGVTIDNISAFEIEALEYHTTHSANPPLNISNPIILVISESFDNINPLFTYFNKMKNPTLNPLASSYGQGTIPMQSQTVSGGYDISNST